MDDAEDTREREPYTGSNDLARLKEAAQDFSQRLDDPGNQQLPSDLPTAQLQQLTKAIAQLTDLTMPADKQVLVYTQAKLRGSRSLLRGGPEMVLRAHDALFAEIDSALADLPEQEIVELNPSASAKGRLIRSQDFKTEIDDELARLNELEQKAGQTIFIIDRRDQSTKVEIVPIRLILDAFVKLAPTFKTELVATAFDLRWLNKLSEATVKLVGQLSESMKYLRSIIVQYANLGAALDEVKRAANRVIHGSKTLLRAIRDKLDLEPTPVPSTTITNDELAKQLREISGEVVDFLHERERHHSPFAQSELSWEEEMDADTARSRETMTLYDRKYGPRIIFLYETAKSRGFEDAEIEHYYDHPVNPLGIRKVGQRLGALAETIKSTNNS